MAFNTEDVLMVVQNIKGYLILMAAALAAAIAITVLLRKMEKEKRRMLRIQTWIAFVLIVTVCVNVICLGVYRDTLNVALQEKKFISDESKAATREAVLETASEGIVLAENEEQILPLADTEKLNVFGWASTNPIYGGSGSGSSDASTAVSLLQGLTDAGIEINTELSDFYTAYADTRPQAGTSVQDYTLPEPTADSYSPEIIEHAKGFSDYAMIVISRVGGECFDLPKDMNEVIHNESFDPENGSIAENGKYDNNGDYDDFEKGQPYLSLSRTERDLVDLVCRNFENVVVVYNGSNTMEMGWVEEYEPIKGVLLCPGTGSTGFAALGKIISGEVNPSGKTADTWVYDFAKTPYYNNVGDFTYKNIDDYIQQIMKADETLSPGAFVDYVENIYVGYKFYETAAEEGIIDFDKTVKYPFGYGLSYTEFKQEMGEIIKDEEGNLKFDVTVTNKGDTAGKEVVEVYYTPPYTNGGIEKASANLIQYEKTDLLEPGESQILKLTFKEEDMASFDTYGEGCYVLEKGVYKISLRAGSHDILDEREYEVGSAVIYNEENPRQSDDTAAVVRFSDVEGDESCHITYLSRKDSFANYEAAVSAPAEEQYNMSDTLRENYMSNAGYSSEAYDNADDEMPVMGAKNDIELMQLRGLDYKDPMWEQLLDELTYEEMANMIEFGGWNTVAIPSIGKIATNDCDGPAGVNNFFTGQQGTALCVEVMIAQTWNKKLAYKIGEVIGQEFADVENFGWYGPALNTHRSAFGGRNFEYYSEDGVLSGYLAAAEVSGAASKGVYAYMKHFALNDQEINTREMLCTWATEQSMREIFLKPFELAVKNFEGSCIGIMNGFNYIGTNWTGASHALLTETLRDEWGFRGMVITDYFGGYGYMNADRGVRAGTDLMLNMTSQYAHLSNTSATLTQAVRQSAKNILYTVVNSGQYSDGVYSSTAAMPGWQKLLIGIDAVLGILLVLSEALAVRSCRRKKSNHNLS